MSEILQRIIRHLAFTILFTGNARMRKAFKKNSLFMQVLFYMVTLHILFYKKIVFYFLLHKKY